MRTTEGLRFLYGYMNYDKQPINIDELFAMNATIGCRIEESD